MTTIASLSFVEFGKAVPTGFETTTLINSGLDMPVALNFTPDGRLWILELGGKIKIYKNNNLLPQEFASVPAYVNSDRGALGIVSDPNWNTFPYIYVYFIDVTDGFHKIWRFTANGDIAAGLPTELYNSHVVAGSNHAGGALSFGSDGKLYFGIGDSGLTYKVTDLSSPLGKILRINPDGSIPSDNPYFGQLDKEQRVWSYGMRNPFRMKLDPVTGQLFEGDVGDSTWEEINIIQKNGNYGWPTVEGKCNTNCTGLTDPIYVYNHSIINGYNAGSITGGFIYRSNNFPAEYYGSYFYADFALGHTKRLTFNSDGTPSGTAIDFDSGISNIVDLIEGPDGAIYLVTLFPGNVIRIRYQSQDQPPTAISSADKFQGPDPLTVTFSSQGSFDPEGKPLSFLWDFGDSTTSTENNPIHTFTQKGTYTVKLQVSDGVNTTPALPLSITVSPPPNLTILSPTDGSLFAAGDTINFSSQATDASGNTIPASGFTTEIRFMHNVHFHPYLPPTQSQSGQFTISPTDHNTESDIWYQIIVSATDTNGLTTTKQVEIFPKKSTSQIRTSPPGLSINVNGSPKATPYYLVSVVGKEHILEANNQLQNGKYYEFDHWTQAGTAIKTLLAPNSDSTLTAVYKESVGQGFLAQYFQGVNLSGPPLLQRLDSQIDFDWGQTSPDALIPAEFFSARWIKNETFEAGRYRFSTISDDGVRLYVDGQLLIDEWNDHTTKFDSRDLDLSAGFHEIKMEYYEAGGGAIVKLDIVQISKETGFNSVFWNSSANTLPTIPKTAPSLIIPPQPNVNFTWGLNAPGNGIGADNFIGQITAIKFFDTALYKFQTFSDDGIRVFIDNELILDEWNDHPLTMFATHKQMSSGLHEIKIEYYENGGGALLNFDYAKQISSQAFLGECYDNPNLAGSPIFTSSDITTLTFNWKNGSPSSLVPLDNFSCRFVKSQNYLAGKYDFTITADDGVRLFIDGVLVLDQWQDQPATTHTHTQDLSSGTHEIKIEYYERGGSAILYFAE